MNQTNENVVQDQDVVVLGVASVETLGTPGAGEEDGILVGYGISEE